VDFVVDLSGADGDGAVLEGVSLPVATATTASFPLDGHALVNTTYTPIYAGIETAAVLVGSDLAITGDFGADTDWTKGGDWSIAGVATKATGTATALAQTVSTQVAGCSYRLTFTVASVTTPGTLAVSAGGVTLTPRTTAATFTEDFTATSTAALTFTADLAWAGTLDNVSLQPLTPEGVIFRAPVTLTDTKAWHIKVYGRYEVV
jgi:hypothetical protein